MPNRRILSLWFPRLGAERLLRQGRMREVGPFAVVKDLGQMQVLSSLSQEASAAGLYRDQPIRDAQAICPNLVTRLQNEQAEALFLRGLARWSGKFTPWISLEPPIVYCWISQAVRIFLGAKRPSLSISKVKPVILASLCKRGLPIPQGRLGPWHVMWRRVPRPSIQGRY